MFSLFFNCFCFVAVIIFVFTSIHNRRSRISPAFSLLALLPLKLPRETVCRVQCERSCVCLVYRMQRANISKHKRAHAQTHRHTDTQTRRHKHASTTTQTKQHKRKRKQNKHANDTHPFPSLDVGRVLVYRLDAFFEHPQSKIALPAAYLVDPFLHRVEVRPEIL